MTEAILAYGYDLGTMAKPIWKDQQYPEWLLTAEDNCADITHAVAEALHANLDMGREFAPAVQEWRSLRMARECVEIVTYGYELYREYRYLLAWNRTFTAEPSRTWRLESADLAGMSAASGALMWAVEALGLNRHALGFPAWHLACYKD